MDLVLDINSELFKVPVRFLLLPFWCLCFLFSSLVFLLCFGFVFVFSVFDFFFVCFQVGQKLNVVLVRRRFYFSFLFFGFRFSPSRTVLLTVFVGQNFEFGRYAG